MEFKEIKKDEIPYNIYYRIVRDHQPKNFKDKYFIIETLEPEEFNNFQEAFDTYKKYLLEDATYEIEKFNNIINTISSQITLIKLKFNILNKETKKTVQNRLNKNKEHLEILKNIDNIQPLIKKLPEKIKIIKKVINEDFVYVVDTNFSDCPKINKISIKHKLSKLNENLTEFEYCYFDTNAFISLNNLPIFFSSDEIEEGVFKMKRFSNYTIFVDRDKAIKFYELKVSEKINEINNLKNRNLSVLIYASFINS